MARGELLSTIGLYHYDNSLFDNFVIPSVLTRQDLIDRILLETAELEVLLSDFDVYKRAIGVWSRLMLDKWQKMADVLFVEDYDPFSNVNRSETKTYNLATTDDNTRTLNNSTTETPNLTTTEQIQSYDSGTWQDRNKTTRTGTDTFANTGTISDDGDATKTGTIKTDVSGLSTYYSAPDSKIRIVTAEVEMRMKYDLESIIIQDFKNEFCLQIY